MRDGQPSATAFHVAMRRAEHQLLDDPKVFDDPVALRIIGSQAASFLEAHKDQEDIRSRYMRAFVVARSRFAEDALAAAIKRGIRQYVILGPGLDTFAYRNSLSDVGLQIFEVDHPDTQAWKKEVLRETNISIPRNLKFAPVRFDTESLDMGLQSAGFQLDQPAFFAWLGVTMYLPAEAVMKTFCLIYSMCAANGVAFDYVVPRSSLSWVTRLAFDAMASRVAEAGERFRGFFETQSLVDELRRIGFKSIEDLGAEAINERYFRGRSDGLCVHGRLGRLMSACG